MFIVGDVVRLKSGGPKMTVEIAFDDVVHVVWFDPDRYNELHRAAIKPNFIEPADPKKSAVTPSDA